MREVDPEACMAMYDALNQAYKVLLQVSEKLESDSPEYMLALDTAVAVGNAIMKAEGRE